MSSYEGELALVTAASASHLLNTVGWASYHNSSADEGLVRGVNPSSSYFGLSFRI